MGKLLKIMLAGTYPLVTHLAVRHGHPALAVAALLALAGATGWPLLQRTWHRGLLAALLLTAALAALRLHAMAWLLFFPPVVMNLFMLSLFAPTLAAGQEPLISRFARLERGGDLPEDLAAHTRRLTGVWCLYFLLSAAIAAGLYWFASAEAWSLFTNLVSYLLTAALFIGEYAYRRVRFGRYTHANPWQMLQLMRRPDALAALKRQR